MPANGKENGIGCANVSTKIEHAICADPALLEQDSKLAGLTRIILRNTATPELAKQFKMQQKNWLQVRDQICSTGAPVCLLAAYEARNLALSVLTDRIGTAPLTDIQPVIMTGRWSAPDPVAMLSAADNPDQETFDSSLYGTSDFVAHKHIGFSADNYPADGLALPGSTIIAGPDGKTCFKGTDIQLFSPVTAGVVKANDCVRYGWQAIGLKDFSNHLPPTQPGYISTMANPEPLEWVTGPSLAVIEADLKITPDASGFIGFIPAPDAQMPDGHGLPVATILLIKGADGAYYAPVPLDMTGAQPVAHFTIGYEKWLPISPDAGLHKLPITPPAGKT